jgi:hypothetical protein
MSASMPARTLFILALLLFTLDSAWAQSSTYQSQGSGATTTPSAQSEVWGALAFTADGSWATAWAKPSKAEAEANVAVACAKFGRGECKVVSFTGEYCAALATYIGSHSRRRYKLSFSDGGRTVPEAQNAAMQRCNNDSRTRNRCQLRTTVCGDGR